MIVELAGGGLIDWNISGVGDFGTVTDACSAAGAGDETDYDDKNFHCYSLQNQN